MNFILRYRISIILILALVSRVVAIYFYGDDLSTKEANEWGIILNNLEENNILSVHTVQGVPVPNIFMPPLYPLFLYFIKLFFNSVDFFIWAILYIQLILSLITIYLAHIIFLEFPFWTTLLFFLSPNPVPAKICPDDVFEEVT